MMYRVRGEIPHSLCPGGPSPSLGALHPEQTGRARASAARRQPGMAGMVSLGENAPYGVVERKMIM